MREGLCVFTLHKVYIYVLLGADMCTSTKVYIDFTLITIANTVFVFPILRDSFSNPLNTDHHLSLIPKIIGPPRLSRKINLHHLSSMSEIKEQTKTGHINDLKYKNYFLCQIPYIIDLIITDSIPLFHRKKNSR